MGLLSLGWISCDSPYQEISSWLLQVSAMLHPQTENNKIIDALDMEQEDVSILRSPALDLCVLKENRCSVGEIRVITTLATGLP